MTKPRLLLDVVADWHLTVEDIGCRTDTFTLGASPANKNLTTPAEPGLAIINVFLVLESAGKPN
jgi:hypothetical protein